MSDTWTFDGTTWREHRGPGPSAQSGHFMAYDSHRAMTILLGTFTQGGDGREVGEWDGSGWSARTVYIEGIHTHGMVYDPVDRQCVVACAGGQTTVWDPSAIVGGTSSYYSPVTSSLKFARMAYDASRNAIVLVGVDYEEESLGVQTFTWDRAAHRWVRFVGPTIEYRTEYSLAYDPVRRSVALLSGIDGYPEMNGRGDVWDFNGVSWTRRLTGGPSRFRAAAATAADGSIVQFGGLDPDQSIALIGSTTLTLRGTTYTMPTTNLSERREDFSVVFDTWRSIPIAIRGTNFGGFGTTDLSETWGWNGSTWTVLTDGLPPMRGASGAVFDSTRGVTVMFGGLLDNWPSSGETWELGNVAGSWAWNRRAMSGPSARAFPCMAFDSRRNVTVLFGGATSPYSDPLLQDTWEWDGSTWTLRAITGPRPAKGRLMTYDTNRGVCVLVRGGNDRDPLDDIDPEVWEWDGNAWTMRTPTSSDPGRYSRPLVVTYDAARRVTEVAWSTPYGRGLSRELWEWDGNAWTMRSDLLARHQQNGNAYFNPTTGSVLYMDAWGFENHTYTGSPYELRITGDLGIVEMPPRETFVEFGQTAEFRVRAVGEGPFTYQWFGAPNCDRLVDGGRISGSQTDTLTIAETTPGDQVCLIFCKVTSASCGELQTHRGFLRVNCLTSIDEQPEAVETNFGQPASFHVGASGSPPISYRWLRDGAPLVDDGVIAGSDTDTLTLSATRVADRGVYTVSVSDQCSTVSSRPAQLRVNCLTRIDEHPDAVETHLGQPASFHVDASGSPPISYRWLRDGAPLVDDGVIAGSATDTLTLSATRVADRGVYTVSVSDQCSTVSSLPAQLTFLCTGRIADFNGDGFVDFFDYDTFVECFEHVTCPPGTTADFNADGFVDMADYIAFVESYEMGC
ncbi:MAG: hypothetical protein HEQ23_14655 [Tepidisphaera sp.]